MVQLIQQLKKFALHGMSLASVLALTVTGCAPMSEGTGSQLPVARLAAKKSREVALNSIWKGQTYDALREVLGKPELTVNNPNNARLMILIYGVTDDKSDCVDAYTVVNEVKKGHWSVMDYFCR